MSIALWNEIEALKRRLSALEAALIATRKPLLEQAAVNHEAGKSLQTLVHSVFIQHGGKLKSKHVLTLLDLPDSRRRRVQQILKELRATSAARR